MVGERQHKTADESLWSIETEGDAESRKDDDSKTPIRPTRKRFRVGDSPLIDRATRQMLNQTIVEAIKGALYEEISEMSDRIKYNLLETINKAVEGGIIQIRTEVEKLVSQNFETANRRYEVKIMSEAELFESYNTRDEIRIVGVKDSRSSDRSENCS